MSGRVAIVTVARGDEHRSSALARALAAEGATVILVTDDGQLGGRLASELGAEGGRRIAVFSPGADAAADVEALVELATELGGRS